jgi:hypothetical protein
MKRRRPKKPTKHPPGSTGTIKTMRRRHADCELLHHPDDEKDFLPPDFDRATVGELVRRGCLAKPFRLD